MFEADGMKFENEEEYLESLKHDDSYHFTYLFEYIKEELSDDDYIMDEATMEVDVYWDYGEHGYKVNHYCPDISNIPSAYNGDEDQIFSEFIYFRVVDDLYALGISNGTFAFW